MQFFFENYKLGEIDNIIKRFSGQNYKLTAVQVDGLYKYMQFLIDRQVVSGNPGNITDYQSYSSFGSLFSTAMQKSYQQIYTSMKQWLPTRYLAAWSDIHEKTCDDYLKLVLTNTTQLNDVCAKYPFDNLEQLQYFVLAPIEPSIKASLLNATNITEAQYTSIYDETEPDAFGSTLKYIYQLISSTNSCKDPN